MDGNNPFISFIYRSQSIEIDYLTFSKLSNYPEILKLPHSFYIAFDDSENQEVIAMFFSYLLSGIADISKDKSIELYGLSQRYQFYLLAKQCEDFIFETLEPLEIINQVHQFYTEGKDISIYQHLFAHNLGQFANVTFFKFPLSFILNTFHLGSDKISPDDFIQFAIQLYGHHQFSLAALDILQYTSLSKASVKSLELLMALLLNNGKPFPYFDYIVNQLKIKKSELAESDEELNSLENKRESLTRTLISQIGQKDHTDTISFLSELLQTGDLIGASDEQVFNNFLNISEITNSVDSLLEVAYRYEKGIGTKADKKKAMEYFSRAAQSRNHKAITELAQRIIETPNYLKPKFEFQFIKDTIPLYAPHCFIGLGNFYRNGHGCKKSNLKAMYYYQLANKNGIESAKQLLKELSALTNAQTEKEAKYAYDVASQSGFSAIDDELGIPLLKLIADSDYIRAMLTYVRILVNNNQYKVAKEYCNRMIELQQQEGYMAFADCYIKKCKFEKLFKLLFETVQTNQFPCVFYQLYLMYQAGLVVPKDETKEYQYLQLAADLGHEQSSIDLSVYEVKTKLSNKAYKSLEKLAKGKNLNAKYEFGLIIFLGQIDGKPQVSRGISFIREAAEGMHPKACYLYGKMLFEGKYIEKNATEAINYLMRGINYSMRINTNVKKVIDTFYLNSTKKPYIYDVDQQCAIFCFYALTCALDPSSRFIFLSNIIKSLVYANSLAFRYKAARILLDPKSIDNTRSNSNKPRLQIQSPLEAREKEAIEHLRQSSDGGSICGMFQYALHLLYLNEKNSHILSKEIEVDSTYYNLYHCKEAMDLLLNAGTNGFDLALLFYAIYALKFPELVAVGISYLKFLAFDKNFSLAKTQLGILYYQYGDYETAYRFLKENAYKNDREAQYYYGKMLMNGFGVSKDPSLALNFFHMSDDAGFKPAQVILVNLLLEMNDKLQLQSFLKNKFKASSYVMYKYSSLYFDKYFDKPMIDDNIAIDLLKLSSLMGDSDGLWKYGTFLRDGIMVAKNLPEAIEHFRRSCDLGNPSGKSCFAIFLVNSNQKERKRRRPSNANILGTPQIGANYFKGSYEMNNRTGAWCYANCLMRGIGCEMDQLKALSIYVQLSNKYNDKDAQYNIFKMLYNGVIVDVNSIESPGVISQSSSEFDSLRNSIRSQSANSFILPNQTESNLNYPNAHHPSINSDLSNSDENNALYGEKRYVYIKDLNNAIQYLIKAANNGHSTAQWRLGEFLLLGKYFNRKDGKRAILFFKKSAEQGNPRGIWYYSKCLIDGRGGVQKDINKALKFLDQLCHSNKSFNGDAEFMYGSLLIDKMNQIEEGVKYIQKSAFESENSDGLWKLGDLYMKGIGVPKDAQKAKEYFIKSEQKGNKTALFKLSQLILLKYDDKLNKLIEKQKGQQHIDVELKENEINELKEGIELLKQAVSKNSLEAQMKFANFSVTGLVYNETVFVTKDVEKAIELFKIACEVDINNGEAYLMYGLLTKNLTYISRSALLGNSIARIAYGKLSFDIPSAFDEFGVNTSTPVDLNDYIYDLHQNDSNNILLESPYSNSDECVVDGPKRNEQNEKLAAFYFKLIADSGNAEAQYLFALCLRSGRGVEKDQHRAIEYFQKSAESGYRDAKYEFANYLYSSGNELNQNILEKRFQLMKEASDAGNIEAFYKISKIEKDYKKIIEAARKGSKRAIAKCAQAFYSFPNPEPISIDMMDLETSQENLINSLFFALPRDEAFAYLQKASKYNAKCAYYYGLCLRNGIKVRKNDKEAYKFIKKSYYKGFKEKATAVLGLYYLRPDFDDDGNAIIDTAVEKNAPLAFNLFTESLNFNDVFGMNCLGYCYYIEKGLYSNPNQLPNENLNAESLESSTMKNALHYLKMAYTNEEPSGVNNYAVAMFQGRSLDGGPYNSVSLFLKSARLGCLTALKNLKKIYDSVDAEQKGLFPELAPETLAQVEQECINARKDDIFHVELALKI